MKGLLKLILVLSVAITILVIGCAIAASMILAMIEPPRTTASPARTFYHPSDGTTLEVKTPEPLLETVERSISTASANIGEMKTMGTWVSIAILVAVCIPLALIVGTILLGWAAIRRSGGRSAQTTQADEAKMIQDIYHGLMKMEERVEALETLLMESQRKGTKS